MRGQPFIRNAVTIFLTGSSCQMQPARKDNYRFHRFARESWAYFTMALQTHIVKNIP
jgi:hypothetical protein